MVFLARSLGAKLAAKSPVTKVASGQGAADEDG
jgi:hypothetical protein